MRRLKKRLADWDQKESKVDTAQKTITFEDMYPDGICKVTASFYTKMIEFYDINYFLLDIDERKHVLDLYAAILNSFDPSVKVELFLFNRQVSEAQLAAKLEIPRQYDGADDIRREYEEMLKEQAAKGTNGVIKSKYLILGIESDDIQKARKKLANLERNVVERFKALGTESRILNGKERLKILYEYFNQGTMQPFFYSFKDLKESGNQIKDYVAPPAFDFRYPDRFRSGEMFGKCFYVQINAASFKDDLIKRLLNIDDNLAITMHMSAMDPLVSKKEIKRKLADIQTSKIQEQVRAFNRGYDMEILPADIVTYENDAKGQIDIMEQTNQKVINITFLITCFGKNKKRLESVVSDVNVVINDAVCALRPLQYLQEQGFMASSPIGCNDTGIVRSLFTNSTAILIPFCSQELFMQGESFYYGINAFTNNMIMADRRQLRTPSGLILGTPGSGKSFSAKREMINCYLITRDDILICDPEAEYQYLVEALGGVVVKLSAYSTTYINPMEISIYAKDSEEIMRTKADFLLSLINMIVGEKEQLDNAEKGIIDQCITAVYDRFFENPIPENMPILEDLYNALSTHPNPAGKRIADSMYLFVHGSQNYFNHRTNVNIENRIICYDIKNLGNQLKDIGMLIIQDSIWNRVISNKMKHIATRYYCDECHLLLRDPVTAGYFIDIWKRFRKWGGIPTAITQNVSDFLKTPEIEGILSNSDWLYLLNQSPKDKKILADQLGLSNEQISHITNAEVGSGLLIFDNIVIPFLDKYPTNTISYRLMSTKPNEDLQNTGGSNET